MVIVFGCISYWYGCLFYRQDGVYDLAPVPEIVVVLIGDMENFATPGVLDRADVHDGSDIKIHDDGEEKGDDPVVDEEHEHRDEEGGQSPEEGFAKAEVEYLFHNS
jgi:hypothetical protein